MKSLSNPIFYAFFVVLAESVQLMKMVQWWPEIVRCSYSATQRQPGAATARAKGSELTQLAAYAASKLLYWELVELNFLVTQLLSTCAWQPLNPLSRPKLLAASECSPTYVWETTYILSFACSSYSIVYVLEALMFTSLVLHDYCTHTHSLLYTLCSTILYVLHRIHTYLTGWFCVCLDNRKYHSGRRLWHSVLLPMYLYVLQCWVE